MFNQKNSKKQGDVGVGSAISYFTSKGWVVLIPLSDSQDYDLAFDSGKGVKTVQIKTSRFKRRKDFYEVNLRVCGGNKSRQTIKNFNPNKVDYVYILLEDGNRYLIPSKDIEAKTSITIYEKYEKYRL